MSNFITEIRQTGNGLLCIKKGLDASDFEQEAVVVAVLLGTIRGKAASGYLADRISRRWSDDSAESGNEVMSDATDVADGLVLVCNNCTML